MARPFSGQTGHIIASAMGAAAMILSGGCGGSQRSCLEIARDYQAMLPAALVCEVDVAASCGAGRPLVVSEQEPDGSLKLEGLCDAPCLGAVNPARTARLDELLEEHAEATCKRIACWCPDSVTMPASCTPDATCYGISVTWNP
jgi:hypothetical protein